MSARPSTTLRTCPVNGGSEYWHPHRRQFMPRMCRNIGCPVCVVPMAHDIAIALAFALPDRQVLLTKVPTEWPRLRAAIKTFRRTLRRTGRFVEDAYHAEPNPAGTGAHIHMWMWGDAVSLEVLHDAAARAGMGCEGVVPAFVPPSRGVPALRYGLKHVINCDLDNPDDRALRAEFIRLNGHHLVHPSQAFWRDGRARRQIAGWRAAAREARRAFYESSEAGHRAA
jgi:hypothetical protein